ncbi:hypothetical protein HOF56_03930 [Candidatus Peribacteria bacterium]|jgi:hypothetical protein|nr:hypothetical protein [Candidatus Peribacteria bacterium]MBT4021420.1 hypothetical protein [Candidatus Peribacteria bacterium]MBT4240436.1 hypothetical protein [Candidatus Peribacteria bacterium]MBT4474518.1 hypothetical protein [Candidatus Peribacteria bacterium]
MPELEVDIETIKDGDLTEAIRLARASDDVGIIHQPVTSPSVPEKFQIVKTGTPDLEGWEILNGTNPKTLRRILHSQVEDILGNKTQNLLQECIKPLEQLVQEFKRVEKLIVTEPSPREGLLMQMRHAVANILRDPLRKSARTREGMRISCFSLARSAPPKIRQLILSLRSRITLSFMSNTWNEDDDQASERISTEYEEYHNIYGNELATLKECVGKYLDIDCDDTSD